MGGRRRCSCASSVLEAAAVDASLAARLRRIETAFRSGEAGSLRPAFTAKAKVRVDLKDVMEGPGSYGPSQLEVIFGRIFDENRTRQFAFRDEDVTVTTPGVAFARARWLRKASGGGSDTTDTAHLHLAPGERRLAHPRDPLVALTGPGLTLRLVRAVCGLVPDGGRESRPAPPPPARSAPARWPRRRWWWRTSSGARPPRAS